MIDFEKVQNNIFKVISQFVVGDKHQRRPDVLLFVNGIPVVICEFKNAIEEGKTTHDAWKQIHNRYTRDIPKLMKYCFVSVLSDGATGCGKTHIMLYLTRLLALRKRRRFYHDNSKILR